MHARPLLLLCLASAGWAFAFGLGSQVCTHWLKHHSASDTLVGLNHACYYLGVAVGSVCAPRLARRLGPACATWGMCAAGLTLALFPWGGGPLGWFALRLGNGWASALSLIPLETLVSRDSPPAQRTRNFGFYALALTLGGAFGIAVGLHLYRPGFTLAFYLGGALPLASALAIYHMPRRTPRPQAEEVGALSTALSRQFLGYGTAWCQGFLEGGMLAFLSLYLLAQGFSADAAGGLMGVTMIGVILFQVPVSWLADRFGALVVLLGCYAVVLAGLIAVPGCTSWPALAVSLFVFGACSGALYPLGLSLLGDAASEQHLARAYAGYLAMECLGSQLGAAAMGRARDLWGEAAMFAVGLGAVLAVLVSWAVLLFSRD
jgi:MFS family permease